VPVRVMGQTCYCQEFGMVFRQMVCRSVWRVKLVTAKNLARCSDKWCAGPCDGSNLLLPRIWPGVLTNYLSVSATTRYCLCEVCYFNCSNYEVFSIRSSG